MKPNCDETLLRQTGSEKIVYILFGVYFSLTPTKTCKYFRLFFRVVSLTIITPTLICRITLTSCIQRLPSDTNTYYLFSHAFCQLFVLSFWLPLHYYI